MKQNEENLLYSWYQRIREDLRKTVNDCINIRVSKDERGRVVKFNALLEEYPEGNIELAYDRDLEYSLLGAISEEAITWTGLNLETAEAFLELAKKERPNIIEEKILKVPESDRND